MLHNTGPYGPNDVPVNHPTPVNMSQISGHINMAHNINNLSKTGQQSVQTPSGHYNLPDYSSYNHPSLSMGSQISHIPTYQHLGLPHSYMTQNSTPVGEMAWQNGMLPMNANVQHEHGVNMMNYQNNYDKRLDSMHEFKETTIRKVPLNIPQITKTSKHISQDNYPYNDTYKYSNHNLDLSVKPPEKIQLDNTRRKNIENTVRLIENILINSTKTREEQSNYNIEEKSAPTTHLSQDYGGKTSPAMISPIPYSSKADMSNIYNVKVRPSTEISNAYSPKGESSNIFNLKASLPSNMYSKAEIYRNKHDNMYINKPDALEIYRSRADTPDNMYSSKTDSSDMYSSKCDTTQMYKSKIDVAKIYSDTDSSSMYSKAEIYKSKSDMYTNKLDTAEIYRSKTDTSKFNDTGTSNMYNKPDISTVYSSKSDSTKMYSSSIDRSDMYSKPDTTKLCGNKADMPKNYSSNSGIPNIFGSKHDTSVSYNVKGHSTSDGSNMTSKAYTPETSTVYTSKPSTVTDSTNLHSSKATSSSKSPNIYNISVATPRSINYNDKQSTSVISRHVTKSTINETKITADVDDNGNADVMETVPNITDDVEYNNEDEQDIEGEKMSDEESSDEEIDMKPIGLVTVKVDNEVERDVTGAKIEVKVENTNFIDMDYLQPFLRDPNGEQRDNVDSKIIDAEFSVDEAMTAIKNDISIDGYLECPHCTLLFNHPKRFLIHIKWHTFGLTYEKRMEMAKEREAKKTAKREAKVIERMKAKEVTDVPVAGKVFPCKDCDKVFSAKSSLKNHRQRTHPTRARECKICKKTIVGWSAMRAHVATHTCDSGYQCMECPKRFKYSHSLAKHKDTHLEKTHGCPECPKMFGSQALLKMHMKTHERVQRGTTFRCTYCGKGFYECYSLQVHERTHRNERPFVCEICNTSFGTNSSLKRHMKVSHSTSKPHECSVCHRSFSTASIRDRHEVRLHSEPEDFKFPCKQCNCKYLKVKDLQKHVYKVHPKNKRRKKQPPPSDSE